MSVWLCIPSKRPEEQAVPLLQAWIDRGYRLAVQRDPGDREESDLIWHGVNVPAFGMPFVMMGRDYSGYAEAVNNLIQWVMRNDPEAEWFVSGGDDTLPDPNHTAEEIAAECSAYFNCAGRAGAGRCLRCTFGVMQPTGDDFGVNPNAQDPKMRGSYISRVAGSPWIGREFARRINQGRGPLWKEYFHCGCDEELQAVATELGVFWQRPDLTHKHMHWARPRPGERMAPSDRMPEFLARANSPEEWRKYKQIFAARQAAGFPGSEPIA